MIFNTFCILVALYLFYFLYFYEKNYKEKPKGVPLNFLKLLLIT